MAVKKSKRKTGTIKTLREDNFTIGEVQNELLIRQTIKHEVKLSGQRLDFTALLSERGNEQLSNFNNSTLNRFLSAERNQARLINYYDLTGIKQSLADKIACIIYDASKVTLSGSRYHLSESKKFYDKVNGLCNNEYFYNEPSFMSGATAFAISGTEMATAGHVFDNKDPERDPMIVIFGYKMTSIDTPLLDFDKEDVFRIKKVIRRNPDTSDNKDFAVFEVENYYDPRIEIPYTKIFNNSDMSNNVGNRDEVYIIGHPFGLPLKYCKGVVDVSGSNYFTADYDSYKINSGSPVFDSNNKVVGIHVFSSNGLDTYTDNASANACSLMRHSTPGEKRASKISQIS
ncbi:MAG: trypsin-like peptidase domain-containing protein [Ignavibacteria bacterium]|nr:trypsin-like peptidase domain-containing protein [Ignavibacteria bacterium]